MEVTPERAEEILRESGAILNGHFRLSSGRHSDRYFQKARVLEHPETTMVLASEIASWYRDVQAVIAPAVGAIALGFAVAHAAAARSVYAEREGGRMVLRRGFSLSPGERVLVVEDVVTTGESAAEVWTLAAELEAEGLGVATLVDRSTGPLPFPLKALVRVDAESWTEAECPLCATGMPVDSPGSRHLV